MVFAVFAGAEAQPLEREVGAGRFLDADITGPWAKIQEGVRGSIAVKLNVGL